SHPDHDEIKEWLDDYDPETADELQIKITLGRIAKRRNAAQARVKKPAS
ncbi:MAG: plasmid pRiA4b ORF-3 family protein, partial [Sphingomonas sp.]|nr:plasmid pRiA4b ORF-3 family protein [Sphingomonas sp.]